MIFQEKKTDNGFEYIVDDVFGNISIQSQLQLEPGLLDDLVMLLLKQSPSAKKVDGEVKYKEGVVKYVFTRRPLWEEEICNDTPTLINEMENESPHRCHLNFQKRIVSIWNWYKRFVEAFRQALKSANSD